MNDEIKKSSATASGNLETMVEMYGPEYVVRQCAEECMELAHALLKYIRAMNEELVPAGEGCNPDACYDHVVEEIADCTLMNSMVTAMLEVNLDKVHEIIAQKVQRTAERLEARVASDAEAEHDTM